MARSVSVWERLAKCPRPFAKGWKKPKRDMVRVPLQHGTIPHTIIGKFGAGSVFLKPASEGTGLIAGGAVRAVLEAAGVQNILTKCMGSHNPHNVVKATMDGLVRLQSPEKVAARRGISVGDLA